MAVLSAQKRQNIAARIWRRISGVRQSTALDKPEWISMIGAVDNWFETVMADANAAIPASVRVKATAKEKAEVLAEILRERFLET